jgi:hypothetical protein
MWQPPDNDLSKQQGPGFPWSYGAWNALDPLATARFWRVGLFWSGLFCATVLAAT